MAHAKTAKLPKTKCCDSSPRCRRCPIRHLKDGTLPAGYTVVKGRLIKQEKGKRSKEKVKA